MDRPTELGARLADLLARSTASDQAATAALRDLQAAGHQLATAMDHLADALEEASHG